MKAWGEPPDEAAAERARDETLRDLDEAGIDLDAVTAKLLSDGLASFAKDFATLLDRVAVGVAQARVGRLPRSTTTNGR